jgi:hypothetical protein
MGSKLTDTNPYLRDPVQRARMVLRSVAGSSAIEGIHHPFKKPASKAGKRTKPAKRSTKPTV